MKLTGSHIILECLLEQGVDTIFGYPGGSVLNIYDALYDYQKSIRHILTAHEQGAVHAADGYARSTGKVGVALVTSGPGATNTVTGIATAYMDSIPLVVITGNVPTFQLGLDSFQEVDITGVTMPVTKHNFIVKDIQKLAATLRRAFEIANSGRKGPVLVDIPKDITAASTEFTRQTHLPASFYPAPNEDSIARAISMLETSQKPLLYIGGGVSSSIGANHELERFVDLFDVPVAASLMGQGGFDGRRDTYLGLLGMHGSKASSMAIVGCDLLVAIGTRFSDRVILKIEQFAPQAKILQIDIDPAEVNKNIRVDHTVVGDAKDVLALLNQRLSPCKHTEWVNQTIEWKQKFPNIQTAKQSDGITPQEVLETLSVLTKSNAIVTTEVGQHQIWTAQYYQFCQPRQFISSGGLGTMGFGLGAAIGAKLGNPEKTVINIAGDGSFHMNCQELVTLAKYQIPVIECILNNGVLGMVRQWQNLFYGKRYSETTLQREVDYIKLAEAYGILGLQMTSRDEIRPVLEQALTANRPVLLNIKIDPDLNVLPMVPAGGSIGEPILEIDD